MNKISLATVVFVVSACGREAPSPTSSSSIRLSAVRILAFGDSLTAGKDLEDPDTQAYPAVLEEMLRARGHDVSVLNAGRSGDTTADALARLSWSLEEKPHIIVVALGSNDTFQGKKTADMERNLGMILARCRASGAQAILVPMKTFPNFGPTYGASYERIFPRAAEKSGALLAPFILSGVAGNPALNTADGIHPNPAGHRRMAENLLPVVEQALRSLNKPVKKTARWTAASAREIG